MREASGLQDKSTSSKKMKNELIKLAASVRGR